MAARILIVEDEQIIAADLRNKVRRMGHEVIGMAITGEEAIGLADQFKPDLVLMDVQLEGEMSGAEAAHTIQARIGAPVSYVTAFAWNLATYPGQKAPPGICLGKPFTRVQLETAIWAALGGERLT